MNSFYHKLLGVDHQSTEEEIKSAYRKLVRKNHPDLFPENKKKIQEIKMIQINEAYKRVLSPFKKESNHQTLHSTDPNNKIIPDNRELVIHKDLDYIYYKKAFNYFKQAVHRSFSPKSYQQGLLINNYHYQRFLNSIKNLRLADTYFYKVITDYPNSQWAIDSYAKIKRIDELNHLYYQIISNMEDN